ncbi:MAG: glycoside hydrolase family 3 C-terminal domain-containing protein [Clostridia bacterium]|nr:glycoside hydrolase family 3 C-terminal domain-containing protein [Clostridia bacterium]
MTLEEKVGQLFMVAAWGATATSPDADARAANRELYGVDDFAGLIARYHVGGAIYFPQYGNLVDPRQVAALSNGIQRAAAREDPAVPLLLATDEEGGIVTRMPAPFVHMPGNMALGATGDPALAEAAARVTGRQLRALGVDLDLAPVADVAVNPANPVIGLRSFGADPASVARFTAQAVRGYRQSGVAAAAKHFPGHGDTDVDSHAALPVVRHSLEEWRAVDLPPFLAAIDAGVDVVMAGHLAFPALDPSGRPATLSPVLLTDILRGRLGFSGVVMTDSLAMAGVRGTSPDAEVAVEAFLAGADVLLMPPDLPGAWSAVLAAVRSGRIGEARLDASVRRILTLKAELGLFADPYVDPGAVDRSVGTEADSRLAAEIAAHGVTLLPGGADTRPALPLGRGDEVLVAGYPGSAVDALAGAMAERGVKPLVAKTGAAPTGDLVRAVVAKAREGGARVAVVLTRDAAPGGRQAALVEALVASLPTVAVAVGTPYDVRAYPDVDAYLATYGTDPTLLRALADVLTGAAKARGRLPVSIPRADDPSRVLYPLGQGG